jgi:hypothetical protein
LFPKLYAVLIFLFLYLLRKKDKNIKTPKVNYNIHIDLNEYLKEENVPQKFKDNYSEIETFLLQNLTCPYPDITKKRLNLISTFLYDLWLTICEKYSLDSESNFVYYSKSEAEMFLLDEDLELELYPTIIRVRRWIHLAERNFKNLCRPYLCELLTKGKYSKHYSTKQFSIDELKEITSNKKPSKFFYRPNDDLFRDILDACLLHFFFHLLNYKNLKVAIECTDDIGVDNGEVTKFLLMEIDVGSKKAHCRPIQQSTFNSSRFDFDPIIIGDCYDDHLLSMIKNNRNGLRIRYDDNIDFNYIDLDDRLKRI